MPLTHRPAGFPGARLLAPSVRGSRPLRLLTPVSSANAAASVTNPAAFVTHTAACNTHDRLCNKHGRVGINRSASSYLLSSSTTTVTPLRTPMQSITSPQ